jgi:hypothetical protein
MKLLFRCLILTLLFANSYASFAQKDTLNVLFVGNSYTYYSDLPKMVSKLSKSTSTFIKTKMSAVGGARLKYHYNQENGLKTKDLIKKGNFDIVVLQEQSMGTLTNKKEFLLYSKKLSDYIKEHGAKPYFFTTWSREKTPQTQNTITKVYKETANVNNGKVVLVGDVWAKALKKHPELDLYVEDGSHPTLLGTFLSAVTFVKTITGEVPPKINNTEKLDLSNLQLCLEIVSAAKLK